MSDGYRGKAERERQRDQWKLKPKKPTIREKGIAMGLLALLVSLEDASGAEGREINFTSVNDAVEIVSDILISGLKIELNRWESIEVREIITGTSMFVYLDNAIMVSADGVAHLNTIREKKPDLIEKCRKLQKIGKAHNEQRACNGDRSRDQGGSEKAGN